MIAVTPSAEFEAVAQFETGLVGTIGVRLRDNEGNDALARTTAGITEDLAGSGIYVVTLTAPADEGQYTIVWDDGGTPEPGYALDDLLVTGDVAFPIIGPSPSARDLCSIYDVMGYVPAYVPNAGTHLKLHQLITAESELIMSDAETGREIVGPADPEARTFDIHTIDTMLRGVDVGDLSSTDDLVVEILNPDLTVARVVDGAALVVYWDGKRYPVAPWEPITRLAFPYGLANSPTLIAPSTFYGQVVRVTGSWGFPTIPQQIREACAARVILRYLGDVTSTGTDFAQAVSESGLNIQGLFQVAQDAIASLSAGVVMA
jgi:hypothetical protein